MLCKLSQAQNHLLHLHWNRGGSTDGIDSNNGLTNGDCSNGILSFLALSPVSSFHLSIKVGLWILTEPTASFTRRSSWMKRERCVTMSWIHLSIPIHSSRHTGDWIIKVRAFTHNYSVLCHKNEVLRNVFVDFQNILHDLQIFSVFLLLVLVQPFPDIKKY